MASINYNDFELVLFKLVEKQGALIEAIENGDSVAVWKVRAALDVMEREARKVIRTRKEKGLPLSPQANAIWLMTGGDDAE